MPRIFIRLCYELLLSFIDEQNIKNAIKEGLQVYLAESGRQETTL